MIHWIRLFSYIILSANFVCKYHVGIYQYYVNVYSTFLSLRTVSGESDDILDWNNHEIRKKTDPFCHSGRYRQTYILRHVCQAMFLKKCEKWCNQSPLNFHWTTMPAKLLKQNIKILSVWSGGSRGY